MAKFRNLTHYAFTGPAFISMNRDSKSGICAK